MSPLFLLSVWLQTIPVALLSFSPFEDGALVRRRRTCRLLSVGFVLLACMVLALISQWASEDGIRNYPIQHAGMMVIILLYFCGWCMSIKAPYTHKLMVVGMLIHYAAALNALGTNLYRTADWEWRSISHSNPCRSRKYRISFEPAGGHGAYLAVGLAVFPPRAA